MIVGNVAGGGATVSRRITSGQALNIESVFVGHTRITTSSSSSSFAIAAIFIASLMWTSGIAGRQAGDSLVVFARVTVSRWNVSKLLCNYIGRACELSYSKERKFLIFAIKSMSPSATRNVNAIHINFKYCTPYYKYDFYHYSTVPFICRQIV